MRIALYSHDGLGLGHLRRNLAIAEALSAGGRNPVLLVSGAIEATAFTLPPGVDCLALPAMRKVANGAYRPRRLGVPPADLVRIRARTITAALSAFEPEVFVVDKQVVGMHGELEIALRTLRAEGTRCVLGLRDVLDEPSVVRREWADVGGERTVAELYDAIWVYGDRRVYDAVTEYAFSDELAARSSFTGYIDRYGGCPDSPRRAAIEELGLDPDRPLAACFVGGGEDGEALAAAFTEADLPDGTEGVVVTGPFMPGETRCRLRATAGRRPGMHVLDFVPEPRELLAHARAVVAMGGYNTVCELLSADKRALIVPRIEPRREQLIRAERLRDLDVVDMLHPGQLSPERLGRWLGSGRTERPSARTVVDLDGLLTLAQIADEPLGAAA